MTTATSLTAVVPRGLSVEFQAAVEYWVARSSRAMTAVVVREKRPYAAGTGSAVTDLIFSIAKREVTFFSGTAPISFL
jgi:hypothetical protein